MKQIEEIVKELTNEEKQILKDTINFGYWGDTEEEFLNEDGNSETVYCDGFCTNDAKLAKNFSGRKISSLFKTMYSKLCPNEVGEIISHCSDWWCDNSGDMLFIRSEYTEEFKKWAREKKMKKSSEKLA